MAADHDDLRRENEELRSRLAHAERLATIVEASSAAIVSTATDGTIMCWNAAAERLYGFTAGDAVGRSVLELVPFEHLGEHRDLFERACRGAPVAVNGRRRRSDGSQITVAVTYVRLVDPRGKLLGVSMLAYPVSAE